VGHLSQDVTKAERGGFEPPNGFEPVTRFPVVPVQPLRHLSGSPGKRSGSRPQGRSSGTAPGRALGQVLGQPLGRSSGTAPATASRLQGIRPSDLPDPIPQQWHRRPVTEQSIHGHLIGPDHEVDVDLTGVGASFIGLVDD
jgi:hypothetical protein